MKFSIVIPTYNRGALIGKTIDSLLRQEYREYEIIVVDDGSTDNTEEVVKSIQSDKVSYYKKANGERGAARNFGAQRATGSYINFFDSDDLAYRNHLAEAAKVVQHLNSPEVFELAYDIKEPDGNLLRVADTFPPTLNESLINGNHLSCNGVFIRKDIAYQHPFNENRVLAASEDYELWLRLAARYPFHCVNVVTSTVVNHEARSVLKINVEKFLARIDYLQESLRTDVPFLKRYGRQLNLFAAYLNIYIALHLAMAKIPGNRRYRHLWIAAKLYPRVIFSRRFIAATKNAVL